MRLARAFNATSRRAIGAPYIWGAEALWRKAKRRGYHYPRVIFISRISAYAAGLPPQEWRRILLADFRAVAPGLIPVLSKPETDC